MQYTDDERQRIGRAVEARRVDLGWGKEEAARRAKISSITWKKVEDGLPVQATKLRRIESTLGWGIGSVDQVARGREPISDQKAAQVAWGALADEDELWRGFKESTLFAELCRQRGANDEMCRYFIADALSLLNSAAAQQQQQQQGQSPDNVSVLRQGKPSPLPPTDLTTAAASEGEKGSGPPPPSDDVAANMNDDEILAAAAVDPLWADYVRTKRTDLTLDF